MSFVNIQALDSNLSAAVFLSSYCCFSFSFLTVVKKCLISEVKPEGKGDRVFLFADFAFRIQRVF